METKPSDCYDGIQPVLSTFNIGVYKNVRGIEIQMRFHHQIHNCIISSYRIQGQHTACEAVRRSLEFAAWRESSESQSWHDKKRAHVPNLRVQARDRKLCKGICNG